MNSVLMLLSLDISDEVHLWGLIHAPFGYESSALTDCPVGQKVRVRLLITALILNS